MNTYKTLSEAIAAAELVLNSKVGIEYACGVEIEFYSKNDPANSDTFTCYVEDGKERFCQNGGEVIEQEMTTKYVITWNNGSQDRYMDDFNTKGGTFYPEEAKHFDTKEEAELIIKENEYFNCGVMEIEAPE